MLRPDGWSRDALEALIASPHVTFDVGLELVDVDGQVVEDLTEWLVPAGSQVMRDVSAAVHGRCRLTLARELDWGRDRVRPYMTVSDGRRVLRQPLGVYVLATPETVAGEDPPTFTVDGYDLLEVLHHPHGATVVAEAGESYLQVVRELIGPFGVPVSFAAEGEGEVLPSDMVWTLDEAATTLQIVNELLDAAGYRDLWMGPSGTARSEPLLPLQQRGEEWRYVTDGAAVTVGPRRRLTHEFFDTPNRMVFVWDDPDADSWSDMVVRTLDNVDVGPTSQQARGRVITAGPVKLEAANAATFRALTRERFDQARQVEVEVEVEVAANPTHWHRDVVRLVDGGLSQDGMFLVAGWSLPLDGSDMQLTLRRVPELLPEPEDVPPQPPPVWHEDTMQIVRASSNSPLTPSAPVGVEAGDMVVAVLHARHGGTWDELPDGFTVDVEHMPSENTNVVVATKMSDGDEPSNYTFRFSRSTTRLVYLARVSGGTQVGVHAAAFEPDVSGLSVGPVIAPVPSLLISTWNVAPNVGGAWSWTTPQSTVWMDVTGGPRTVLAVEQVDEGSTDIRTVSWLPPLGQPQETGRVSAVMVTVQP